MNTISRSLSAGPGAVQLVDRAVGALKLPMFGFAVHWRESVSGTASGSVAVPISAMVPLAFTMFRSCGHAGDDGREPFWLSSKVTT